MSVLAFASVAPAPVATRAAKDHFIRIAGQPVRVCIDVDDQRHHLTVDGLCPTCGKDTDWTTESVSSDQAVLVCRSCDQGWPLEFGAWPPPSPVETISPISFISAGRLSLHVEAIAQELCAAALTAAGLPPIDWRLTTTANQERFRRHASVAILRLHPTVHAMALAEVRMFHGGAAGEAAVETYHRALVKHAPMTGGR